MKFGGTYDFNWVNREHLEKFARQAKLNPAALRRLLLDLCKKLPVLAGQCAVESDRPVCKDIAGSIAKRADLLTKRFTQA